MRKLLTAGIFGTILSLTGANYAGASIISRGFFDEAMENYATNTALDLKANQTDLTALSNKIGDAWPYSSDMSEGLYNLSWQLYPQEITLENASDLVRFLFGGKIESGINQGGVLNILGQNVVVTGAYDVNTGQIDKGFRSLTQLTNGWTSTDGTTYLGVKDLNTKTGSYYWGPENEEYKYSNIPYLEELFPDLSPDKNLAISNMATTILVNYTEPDFPGLAGVTNQLLNGWTNTDGDNFMGLKELNALFGYRADLKRYGFAIGSAGSRVSAFTSGVPSDYYEEMQELLDFNNMTINYPNTMTDFMKAFYGSGDDGIIFSTFVGWGESVDGKPKHKGLFGLNDAINGSIDSTGNVIEPGLYQITNGWTDAKGGVIINPGLKGMYNGWTEYGNELPGLYEIANDILKFKRNFSDASILTLLAEGLREYTYGNYYTGPIYPLWKLSEGIDKIASIEPKIGDLPTEIPNVDSIWDRYGFVENRGTPIDLPDTIGGMFAMLFNEDGSNNVLSLRNIMARILMGINLPTGGRIEGLANLSTAYNLVGDSPIVTAVNANTAKIGTLPTEYATVGAALTAMKSDIDAKNLPSTSDDGQYVLTAKKVGDTITYTWVKMDLTNEEQAQ
ncbi:MAG: hypothetical protein IJN91_05260 [Alphaproteobacteria bacterium]|nr:hypothetical protein [Alphaproteobacteria bacterium]